MLFYFIVGQALVALVAARVFWLRGRHWSLRHTLLATVLPLVLFLLWISFWCWVPLSDLAPTPVVHELLNGTPFGSAIIWMCLLPIIVSWLLFFWLSDGRATG